MDSGKANICLLFRSHYLLFLIQLFLLYRLSVSCVGIVQSVIYGMLCFHAVNKLPVMHFNPFICKRNEIQFVSINRDASHWASA